MGYDDIVPFSTLVGKTIKYVDGAEPGSREITFLTTDLCYFSMNHEQYCCESVNVEEVIGDVQDLIGVPIVSAEESSNESTGGGSYESATWTFYRLATAKGPVVIRWRGESYGRYSVSVNFEKVR